MNIKKGPPRACPPPTACLPALALLAAGAVICNLWLLFVYVMIPPRLQSIGMRLKMSPKIPLLGIPQVKVICHTYIILIILYQIGRHTM